MLLVTVTKYHVAGVHVDEAELMTHGDAYGSKSFFLVEVADCNSMTTMSPALSIRRFQRSLQQGCGCSLIAADRPRNGTAVRCDRPAYRLLGRCSASLFDSAAPV